jgi:hypothetical protein
LNTCRLSDDFSQKHVMGGPQVAVVAGRGDAGNVALVVADQLGDGAKGAGDALLRLMTDLWMGPFPWIPNAQ